MPDVPDVPDSPTVPDVPENPEVPEVTSIYPSSPVPTSYVTIVGLSCNGRGVMEKVSPPLISKKLLPVMLRSPKTCADPVNGKPAPLPPPSIVISTLVGPVDVTLATPLPKKFKLLTPVSTTTPESSILIPENPGMLFRSRLCVTLLLAKKNNNSDPCTELE